MRKTLLSAFILACGLFASAQIVEIGSVAKVNLPEGMAVMTPTLSPDGSFVVVSDAGNDALYRINVADGNTRMITENGSGNGVVISNDGTQVVFRQSTIDRNHMRKVALKSIDLTTGREKQLVAPSRHLNTGVGISGNCVTSVENGKAKKHRLAGAPAAESAFVSINYGHLDYTVNGQTVTLDPQGRGSYLWPSLSPDGKQIVYYLAGMGCFVCNVDGTNVRPLGMLRAAKWLNNETVVGMNDVDNGHYTTSSSVIASKLDGTRQTLTSENMIAMFPSPSADGEKIAFVSADGELFVINLIK